MSDSPQKLWTKNFTIITLGSVVSMMGNTVAGFAISLMVLDYTESVFLYTLFMVAYNLPKLIMPLLSGPWLDTFSRRKVIYGLDFISSAIYLGIFVLISTGNFSYLPFLLLCTLIGSIDSVYLVAYDSLYPTLVSPGFFRKAYSISSILTTLSMVVAPIATYVYGLVGSAAPLFLFNACTFLVAAIMETQIKVDESHIQGSAPRFSLSDYRRDFREGLRYIGSEPGLMIITAYFFFSSLAMGAESLALPYFKVTHSAMAYMKVMLGAIVGRALGGSLLYRRKLPGNRKFAIARMVYIGTSVIMGIYLFMPNTTIMMLLMFLSGLMGVTSYNIRIASTQTYVPNSHRARFNGTFQMITNLGGIMGQLACGALAEAVPIRAIFVCIAVLQLVAIFFTMGIKGKHVEPIYNMDL